MQFHDNLEIPWGNTRRQIKVEVVPGYWSTEDKCLHLHRKWYLKENMVGTTIAKGQIPDIRWTYTKEIINLRKALVIRSTSCPWAWTQVQGRLPLLQCITFHSLLTFDEVAVLKFYLVKHQKSMTHENFRVRTYYERHRFNPSGHRGNIYHKLQ